MTENGVVVKLGQLTSMDRSSCASHKVCYGRSFSTAGGIGTDQPSSAGRVLAPGYGDGGGVSINGQFRTQNHG